MKKILFGAGLIGVGALTKYGENNIAYFVDNNPQKVGKRIRDVEIISWEKFLQIYRDYEVIITTKYSSSIEKQLNDAGITNYTYYYSGENYKTKELVVNPYQEGRESDSYWETSEDVIKIKIEEVNQQTEKLHKEDNLEIKFIELETINRCNGTCSFCPVNRYSDPRKYAKMSDDLFKKIIDDLVAMQYKNRLALFVNNEPFLDKGIIEKHKYVREKLPDVRMHLYTNGTLLTVEKFVEIMKYLDELVIDNYNQELKLIKNCEEIVRYCEEHPEYTERVTIVLRKSEEILSTRGGDAPNNNKQLKSFTKEKCVYPFKNITVRSDGKVSLCCNDALGKYTLGDLNKNTISEIWNGKKYQEIRELIYKGRENIEQCKYCDMFIV